MADSKGILIPSSFFWGTVVALLFAGGGVVWRGEVNATQLREQIKAMKESQEKEHSQIRDDAKEMRALVLDLLKNR